MICFLVFGNHDDDVFEIVLPAQRFENYFQRDIPLRKQCSIVQNKLFFSFSFLFRLVDLRGPLGIRFAIMAGETVEYDHG